MPRRSSTRSAPPNWQISVEEKEKLSANEGSISGHLITDEVGVNYEESLPPVQPIRCKKRQLRPHIWTQSPNQFTHHHEQQHHRVLDIPSSRNSGHQQVEQIWKQFPAFVVLLEKIGELECAVKKRNDLSSRSPPLVAVGHGGPVPPYYSHSQSDWGKPDEYLDQKASDFARKIKPLINCQRRIAKSRRRRERLVPTWLMPEIAGEQA